MFHNKGGRHYWFAKYLVRAGYKPVIFCCNVKHNSSGTYTNTKGLWTEKQADEIGVPFVFVQSSSYSGNGIDRVRNMYGFYRNVQRAAREYAKEHGYPSVILASSVHPLTLVAGIKLARELSAGCVCEVRDLWPETLLAYSSRLNSQGMIARLLYRGEKWIYEKADALIFTMEGGSQYIKDRGWDLLSGGPIDIGKVYYINNGIDLEAYDENLKTNAYDNSVFSNTDNPRVVYTGSIRRANGIGFLIDVADCLKHDSIDIFVFGDGEERQSLEHEAALRLVDNIHFMGRVDKCFVPSVLSAGSLSLMTYSSLQSKVSKYGMSQNKLFDYLASGTPIVSNLPNKYSIVNKYRCGIEREFSTPQDCANAIQTALSDKDMLVQWGNNARNTASLFSFERHTKQLIEIIEHVCSERSKNGE